MLGRLRKWNLGVKDVKLNMQERTWLNSVTVWLNITRPSRHARKMLMSNQLQPQLTIQPNKMTIMKKLRLINRGRCSLNWKTLLWQAITSAYQIKQQKLSPLVCYRILVLLLTITNQHYRFLFTNNVDKNKHRREKHLYWTKLQEETS